MYRSEPLFSKQAHRGVNKKVLGCSLRGLDRGQKGGPSCTQGADADGVTGPQVGQRNRQTARASRNSAARLRRRTGAAIPRAGSSVSGTARGIECKAVEFVCPVMKVRLEHDEREPLQSLIVGQPCLSARRYQILSHLRLIDNLGRRRSLPGPTSPPERGGIRQQSLIPRAAETP